MAITTDDFNKIWASTSPLTPHSFSESQYKEGWNFIGSTPPSRQMWDYLQKNNDEKMQYLLTHFDNYLPLSGGTMTGSIQYVENGKVFAIGHTTTGTVDLGWNGDNREGAGLGLRSADVSNPGEFSLFARDANNDCTLTGKPDGTLTWGGKSITDGTFIKVQRVQIPVASGTDTNVGNATAPAISGYEFVAWIYTASDGGVYPCYCSGVLSETATVWVPSSHRSIANGTQISCYALYVRKW